MDSEDHRQPDQFEEVYKRAELLFEQGRHADAAEWFQKAIAINPDLDYPHARLALSWIQHESTCQRAVDAARRAVSLNPENGFNHAVLAMTLLDSSKPGESKPRAEALASAAKAIELEPDSSFTNGIYAFTLVRNGRIEEAEKAARNALQLDPDNLMATQALTAALMQLGKKENLKSLVDKQLQDNPESDMAHVAAGYQALHDGKVNDANNHFREALRLDPGNEAAREGLIESFRARSAFYRRYLQFCSFMRSASGGKAHLILLGGFILFQLGKQTLRKSHPAIAAILGLVWLTFVLWGFYARGIGSMMMLTDPFARMAIRQRERWEGILVGGFLMTALTILIGSLIANSTKGIFAAGSLAGAGIPIACAFTIVHYRWQRFFAAAGCIAGAAALIHTAGFLLGMNNSWIEMAGLLAILIGAASTWISMFSGMGG